MTKPRTYKSEADVKKHVKHLLKDYNYYWWMPGANGYGSQGVADFLALKGGLLIAIETKFGSGKTTALQEKFLLDVARNGGLAMVVRETNLDVLSAGLAALNARMAISEPNPPITAEAAATYFPNALIIF